ncbi:Ig-like domain-containing protein [Kitasatospora brasiliensis]|uniref:Ig-like domain-containing protein n=1 Tax=Kitasatospora brasiliensis TaxID=3058040 RepID=UPI00293026CB|nr:Ig-like domain-containing protein [Kitasatospora sp. K002]
MTSKKPVQLTARTVGGHVIAGAPISGDFEATLTDAHGKPIVGRQVTFYSTASGQRVGSATTDKSGIAKLNSGSKILDPVIVASTLATGCEARFEGDDEYQAASAHAGTAVGV